MDWDLPRSASSLHLLTKLGEERGLRIDEALAGTGVSADDLSNPYAEVTARQEFDVMRRVVQHCGDEPGLGVEAGTRYHIAMYGVWGLALTSCPTIRDTIDVALTYLDLAFAFTKMAFEEAEGEARLIVEDRDIPEDVRVFLVERILSGIRTIGDDIAPGGVPFTRVTLRHPRPADTSTHQRVFGVDPEFGAPRNMLAFDAGFLELPLPQADQWARGTYEHLCDEIITKRRARTGLSGTVRGMLFRGPGELASQAEVASELHLSARTLFRRLADEGTSFRALVEEARETLAEELLVTAGMTTDQVSYRLGYAEPACFIRAFKRWKGVSPQAYRAAQPRGPSLVTSL